MEDEELQAKIEQLRANRGHRQSEWENVREQKTRASDEGQERRAQNPYRGYPFEEEDEPQDRPAKDDGVLGVLTFQGILAVALSILYVLLMTVKPSVCSTAVEEIQYRSANDFSFREQVYETVGGLLTYLNEIQPVDLQVPETEAAGSASSSENTTSQEETQTGGEAASEEETVSEEQSSDLTGQGGEFTPVDGRALPTNATFAPVIFTGQITFPIVGGRITSGFGFREHPTSKEDEFHTALDIAAAQGTNILAAADGIVSISEESGSLGKHIVIDHGNGFLTVYGHCERLLAKAGTRIREGEVIAKVGSTGDSTGYHLHFGIKKDGLYFDPLCVFPGLSLPDDVTAPPPAVKND